MVGTLYIVATPLGNLEDMTFRAVRILKEVDLIAAEDTRHSKKLLGHYGITTPTIACHEHNEAVKAHDLIQRLEKGATIALISDAGTPLISDPGYRLVSQAGEKGIPIVPVPGCNAAITGLSASGLPTDTFVFLGFPPRKQGRLNTFLNDTAHHKATLIFYESPRRVIRLISSAIDAFGDRQACLARELTKQYEEFIRGPLSVLLSTLESRETIKGECVLFIKGEDEQPIGLSAEQMQTMIIEGLNQNKRTSELAKKIAGLANCPKPRVYDMILALKNRS
ncbi:16S rRNA (cytidine(1402)-2'-O)-methyltransferase [Desulfobacter hydrogenophilus]|uniref:Ribosomal RNA small subunit methyltransferase I n=1 Tax=Desulfobacter hydrogenophilus TaxID=2291 RepID=A0A328FC40_9BACT|nr:16S rRNA (cytidine(1402)-2'-O)-methyltransferase [Desulfobacter hydrogenophilus]NDY70531.1 16S rRNA (cytidine(1402)-2'-O)-methyltransferase [Desulfobacter hydrogenophilus]QBH13905.1 16S rRNA (cytidine(1402)-2'-O)-methyltransferase [Desulfobacter hydrogenophilus]RAM02138.1 16S rRNA (cytidine(1402)-2'-O)-methyltransferase [Desulfobacter hydrogenophilus]